MLPNKDPQKYWSSELDSSRKRLSKWHKQADKIVDRFLGKQATTEDTFSVNLFHSNMTTLNALLYGNLPTVDVSRRYADANDDIARVAAATMERLLNSDISAAPDSYDSLLRSVLQDRLLPGLGVARVRYEYKTENVVDPMTGMTTQKLVSESAPLDYFHWRDVLWGWSRSHATTPWIAYRSYLTKAEAVKRFGQSVTKMVTFKKQQVNTPDSTNDAELDGTVAKVEVWELWDKKTKKVYWVNPAAEKLLDTRPDPLKLSGFFPSPAFFLANQTTSLYIPTPDYTLSQDLYDEVDSLQTRISIITTAVRVVGVYDKASDGIGTMLSQCSDNQLIPVDNWAMFAEQGGLRSQIDWFPIGDVVAALDKLRALRDETIGLLQQVTGLSDIMAGGLNNQYEGVGQSKSKVKFGSIRIQKIQEDFATFASGLLQLKAEVIARHFAPETIAKQSNMINSFDREKLVEAIQLIKQPDTARLRIVVRPETIAMADFAEMQGERISLINSLSTFMQAAGPLIQSDPDTKPMLLQVLKWSITAFKGSSEIEGVLDKAIEASGQKNPDDKKPDPQQQAAKSASELEKQKLQGELQKIQAKAQAEMQTRQDDLSADLQTSQFSHQAKLQEIEAGMQSKVAEIEAKLTADLLVEEAQARGNIMQSSSQTEGEMVKNEHGAQLDISAEAAKTSFKIQEIKTAAATEILKTEVTTDGQGQ